MAYCARISIKREPTRTWSLSIITKDQNNTKLLRSRSLGRLNHDRDAMGQNRASKASRISLFALRNGCGRGSIRPRCQVVVLAPCQGCEAMTTPQSASRFLDWLGKEITNETGATSLWHEGRRAGLLEIWDYWMGPGTHSSMAEEGAEYPPRTPGRPHPIDDEVPFEEIKS